MHEPPHSQAVFAMSQLKSIFWLHRASEQVCVSASGVYSSSRGFNEPYNNEEFNFIFY